MTYKFNLAGPGSPEIEMRGPRLLGGYRLYMNGKALDKAIYPNKLYNIQLLDGKAVDIVYDRFFFSSPFSPPLVTVNWKPASIPEPDKHYEMVFYYIQYFVILFSTLYFVNNIPGATVITRLWQALIVIIGFGLLYIEQYLYYTKARPKFRTLGRIAFFVINLVALFIFIKGAMAIIKIMIS